MNIRRQKKYFWAYVIIAFHVVLFSVLLYRSTFTYVAELKLHTSPTPTIDPLSYVVQVPIAGWNTYGNSRYVFSLQYPQEAVFSTLHEAKTSNFAKILRYGAKQQGKPQNVAELTDGYAIEISFITSKQVSVADYAEQAHDATRVECSYLSKLTPVSDIKVNQKASKTFTITECTPNSYSTQYFINYQHAVIHISINVIGEPAVRNGYIKTVEGIIKTIKLQQ